MALCFHWQCFHEPRSVDISPCTSLFFQVMPYMGTALRCERHCSKYVDKRTIWMKWLQRSAHNLQANSVKVSGEFANNEMLQTMLLVKLSWQAVGELCSKVSTLLSWCCSELRLTEPPATASGVGCRFWALWAQDTRGWLREIHGFLGTKRIDIHCVDS